MKEILLYTTDTCSRCKIVKDMLNMHSVKYQEVTDRQLMLNMDLEGVPAIEVDGQVIDNYVSVLAWLESKGYYSPEVTYND